MCLCIAFERYFGMYDRRCETLFSRARLIWLDSLSHSGHKIKTSPGLAGGPMNLEGACSHNDDIDMLPHIFDRIPKSKNKYVCVCAVLYSPVTTSFFFFFRPAVLLRHRKSFSSFFLSSIIFLGIELHNTTTYMV